MSDGTGIVTRSSPVDHAETLARLDRLLSARGLQVFGRVDHTANAREAGLEMPPSTVVIFGNARGGTPLMLAAPDIALDLPLRILVRDEGQRTLVSYHDPNWLAAQYGLPAELAAGIAGLAAVVDAVTAVP